MTLTMITAKEFPFRPTQRKMKMTKKKLEV